MYIPLASSISPSAGRCVTPVHDFRYEKWYISKSLFGYSLLAHKNNFPAKSWSLRSFGKKLAPPDKYVALKSMFEMFRIFRDRTLNSWKSSIFTFLKSVDWQFGVSSNLTKTLCLFQKCKNSGKMMLWRPPRLLMIFFQKRENCCLHLPATAKIHKVQKTHYFDEL